MTSVTIGTGNNNTFRNGGFLFSKDKPITNGMVLAKGSVLRIEIGGKKLAIKNLQNVITEKKK